MLCKRNIVGKNAPLICLKRIPNSVFSFFLLFFFMQLFTLEHIINTSKQFRQDLHCMSHFQHFGQDFYRTDNHTSNNFDRIFTAKISLTI